MRTIKLTHEELALVLQALGIAEQSYSETRLRIIKDLINVRGVDNGKEQRAQLDFINDKENAFCDLLLSIKNGEKDV